MLLDEAAAAKADPHRHAGLLRDDTVALYFAKPSTRIRLALETAIARLGGVSLILGPGELDRGETLEDTAQVVRCYVRAIVVRGPSDRDLRRLPRAATVPVVNALPDGDDPCQTLAGVLEAFRVDERLPAGARPDALFLHCLPAHGGEEVTSEVIDGPPVPDDTGPLAAAITAAVRHQGGPQAGVHAR